MKNETAFFYIFIACCVAFLVGVLTGHGIGAGRIGELENRLADATNANHRLADENNTATELASRLADRLRARQGRDAIAIGILDEIGRDLGRSETTIDRAIRRVELIESALSVLLDDWQD
jgi:hypothetical protein